MLTLLLCWFLFAQPLIIWGSMVLGAQLYAKGGHGQVPGIVPVHFGVSRSKQNGKRENERLPEV